MIKNHFFSSDFESVTAQHLTGNILSFDFYPKAIYLLTFQSDRLDLGGLDLGKSDIIYSLA